MALLIVEGEVIFSNSGREFGVRGWLVALDAATGNIVWKAYWTGPVNTCSSGRRRTTRWTAATGCETKTWRAHGWKTGGSTL